MCPSWRPTNSVKSLKGSNMVCQIRVPTLLLTKNPGLSRTPKKNFPGPFQSPRMSKYKEKTAFTYNIQSIVHCRKFSMKQNVLKYCCLFSIWTTRKMHDFQGYFSRTFQVWYGVVKFNTLSFNFQDFPGPKWFSRTFQEAWEPCQM